MQRILLVDDKCDEWEAEFLAAFDSQGIEVSKTKTPEEAKAKIDSGLIYDAVVLDWELETGDSEGFKSKIFLKHLKQKLFIPVLIWSDYLEYYNQHKDELDYPAKLIDAVDKADFTPEQVKQKIQEWLNTSTTAKISKLYRTAIREGLEQNFFELAELPEGEFAAILKVLVGEAGNIDWGNDFILNLIHRKLLANKEFVSQLDDVLKSAKSVEGEAKSDLMRKLINRALYFSYDASVIKSADIVVIEIPDEGKKLGIVVTPDCDLEWNKTRYLELVELKEFKDESLKIDFSDEKRIENIKTQNEESYYFFPAVPLNKTGVDLLAVFKSKIILEEIPEKENMKAYPKAFGKLKYPGKFLYRGKEVKVSFVCSKSNPYKSDFLHSFHSHNSRVGTPDIRKLLN